MDATLNSIWLAIWAMVALFATRLALKWLSAKLVVAPNSNGSSTAALTTPFPPARSLKGPPNLPIVGYLPFITQMPHRKFQLLAEKYGPIFKINLGNMETIVLNDFRSICLAFKKEEFLGRPRDIAFNVLINLEGEFRFPCCWAELQFDPLASIAKTVLCGLLKSVALANVSSAIAFECIGAEWRQQKRFTMQQMRNLGLGKFAIEQHIKGNIDKVIDRIEGALDRRICGGQLFAVDNFGITSLLFGHTIDCTNGSFDQLEEAIANAIRSLGQVSLLTFFPRMARLLARFKLVPFINQLKANFVLVYTYIKAEIENHRQTLNEHSVRDYIDSFLLECRRRKDDGKVDGASTFTEQMLAGNVQGFLAAGIETVRTTLHWALLILATHQDVQQRVFREVHRVCGNSTPNWTHRAAMVYTQAVICEMQRWKTISPLNLMRMTTADTTLDGFAIAKGTHVIANLWAVHFDTAYWRNPHQFDPERFIGPDKQLIKHQQFIPFSIGKRSCPGESLAQMEVFLYVTCLVQNYLIELTEENSLEEVLGLTLQPKEKPQLQFTRRATS